MPSVFGPTQPCARPSTFPDPVRGQRTREEFGSCVCYRVGARSGRSASRTSHLRCLLLHELSTTREGDPTDIVLLHQVLRIRYDVKQRGRSPETRSAALCIARFGSQQRGNRLRLLGLLTTRQAAASATSRLFSKRSFSYTMSGGRGISPESRSADKFVARFGRRHGESVVVDLHVLFRSSST